MTAADEDNCSSDDLTKRVNALGWRVISNPAKRPIPEAKELKALIETVRAQGRASIGVKSGEPEPSDAA